MIHIGLTGGIGSGKSTVAKIFETLGIPVYNSDQRAKIIMEENLEVKNKIIELLGLESYEENNLNRKYIASQVFENSKLLNALNAIVHPEVFKDYDDWWKNYNTAYVIKESALLLDTLKSQNIDQIILVFSPLELRIQRILTRDHLTREQVSERIANQRPEKDLIEAADYIIVNDQHLSIVNQVLSIHQELINFANIKS
ncbi:MAG: dephospho-CoA kinase [Saprospiraceae bacterium]